MSARIRFTIAVVRSVSFSAPATAILTSSRSGGVLSRKFSAALRRWGRRHPAQLKGEPNHAQLYRVNTPPPPGIDKKSAHIVGGGIAGLAAAVLRIPPRKRASPLQAGGSLSLI
jgi:hypothetical protein